MTHPFHPLHGREFELVDYRHTWGEDRVYYQDQAGELKRLPAAWTSVGAIDPFVVIAGGRALWRYQDLRQLVALVQRQREVHPSSSRAGKQGKVSSK